MISALQYCDIIIFIKLKNNIANITGILHICGVGDAAI